MLIPLCLLTGKTLKPPTDFIYTTNGKYTTKKQKKPYVFRMKRSAKSRIFNIRPRRKTGLVYSLYNYTPYKYRLSPFPFLPKPHSAALYNTFSPSPSESTGHMDVDAFQGTPNKRRLGGGNAPLQKKKVHAQVTPERDPLRNTKQILLNFAKHITYNYYSTPQVSL